MDLDNKRTMILSSIYRGYSYTQITKTHDCNILMLIGVCRAVIKSTLNKNTSTEHTLILLSNISNDYSEQEYPELWI